MSKQVNSQDLVIGQRYWLDAMKDVSGVYIGKDENSYMFHKLIGEICYYADEEGITRFADTGATFKVFKLEQ